MIFSMNNGEMTPKQALEVLQRLGSLDTLMLNLNAHLAVQQALKVIASVVDNQESKPQPTELKAV